MAELKQKPTIQSDDFINLRDLLYLCLVHWKWFVLSLFITLSAATVYLLRTPSVYTRSASILIKEDSKGNSFSSGLDEFANMGLIQSNTNVNNELLALKSPALMYEVVKRLHLNMNYYLPGTFQQQVAYGTNLPVNVSIDGLSENESVAFGLDIAASGEVRLTDFKRSGEDVTGVATGKLAESLQTPVGTMMVTPTSAYSVNTAYSLKVVRGGLYGTASAYASNLTVALSDNKASVIDLSVRDLSTQRAEDVLNTLIVVYNENWVKDKNQVAVSTSMFINERLAVIESELGNVDENISSFKSENLLPDVQAASNMYMTQNSQSQSQLTALNNQLYMTRYIRNYLTNESNQYQLLPVNSGIENSNIESQISAYNTQLLQRNNLVSNSSTSNPLVVDMDQSLANMRQAIIASVDNQMTALSGQVQSLQQTMRQTTSRIAANPNQAKYLLSVERQQKVKESLYLFLLQKREENELSQAFTAYNTRIINPPGGSNAPIAPVRKNIFLVAFALGLLIPGSVIFIRENMNTRVRGRKDLDSLTIPFIGEIPMMAPEKKGLFKKAEPLKRAIVVKEGKRDIVNEAFRILRTNLEFMTEKEKDNNVILVTSFNPGSGKSFLSMNVAVSLAIKKKRVLVIDGDLRHGSTSAYVDSPSTGISDYLNGRIADWHQIVTKSPHYEYLSVLPVGTLPPNPTELLFDDRMPKMVEAARKEYDFVLIDCPPIELVADTQILEKLADRTVFVVRAGLFERNMLPELERIYTEKKYKNMALILNATEGGGSRYGYKYGYRYGYHYGYGYGYQYGSKKENSGGVNSWHSVG